ncbi:MAG TPA: DUF4129 domain-containing protein [Chloroflexi bacterium]|nr:DUF4129 domain-containing protein [Chloroflexota bacterium]
MLLNIQNQRSEVIYFCLAVMEMVWVTPFVMLFHRPAWHWSLWAVFGALSLALLLWMLFLDRLNAHNLDSPAYELAVVSAIALSSLLLISLWPYQLSVGEAGGIPHLFRALSDIRQGLPLEIYLILLNLFLWQRAANASSRQMGFFGVALSFRMGVLWLMAGGALFSWISGQNVLGILWLYFGFGLTAISLARIEEKAADAHSKGKLLPPRRLLQLLLIIAGVVTAIVILSTLYTPQNLQRLLAKLEPLWGIVLALAYLLFQAIFWLLGPFFNWLESLLAGLFSASDFRFPLQEFEQTLTENAPEQAQSLSQGLSDWILLSLRCLVIVAALSLVLGLIMIFLDKFRSSRIQNQNEETGQESLTLGGGTARRGLEQLKGLGRLLQQYGLSRQLLAAISVENMYANLCRLAQRRGYPRPPAQTPDDYLVLLAKAFPGQEKALARLTAAYQRVHYGDLPVQSDELRRLRSDYEQVRQAK